MRTAMHGSLMPLHAPMLAGFYHAFGAIRRVGFRYFDAYDAFYIYRTSDISALGRFDVDSKKNFQREFD